MKKQVAAALCAASVLCLAGCSPFKSVTSVFKIHGGEDSGVVYIDESYEYPDSSESPGTYSEEGSQSVPGAAQSQSSGQAAQNQPQIGNRYYAVRLKPELHTAYREILTAVSNRADGKIELGGVTSFSDLVLCCTAVRNDYPEYFWFENSFSWEHKGGKFYLHPKYNCSVEELREMNASLSTVLKEFDGAAAAAQDDYEKEITALNWLLPRVTYDNAAAAAGSQQGYEQSYTAYGALVKHRSAAQGGTAVCEGYARAFSLLLNRMGVQNGLVSGKLDGVPHMWNTVKIGSHWYNVDPTSADTGDSMNYCFVNITDKDISPAYTKDKDFEKADISDSEYSGSFNYKLPHCSSREYNYLTLSGHSVQPSGKGAAAIGKQALAAYKRGETSCEFIFEEGTSYRFSAESIAAEINFPECAAPLLAEDPKAEISVSGIRGSCGFKISWKR